MTLTPDDLTILRKRFEPSEHEFHRGFAYIAEKPITDRLEEVDPGYTFEILSTTYRDKQVIVTARMTVKGVFRDGVGMQSILESADKKTGEVREIGEPEKGAATDALKRCARLFGVGRYLLDLPDTIKDIAALAKWLNAPAKPMLVPQPRTERRIPNGNGLGGSEAAEVGKADPRHTPPTLTSADIEAALKGEGTPWHEYRIEHNQAGNMQIVLKNGEGLQDAKEAVAAKGFKIVNAGRNWFVVAPQTA